jgi:epoxyqueuosine reductase QueG
MKRELTAQDLGSSLAGRGIDVWGVAANVPQLPLAPELPTAISLVMRFEPSELEGLEEGPTGTYYRGYLRLNAGLETAAAALANELRAAGYRAEHVEPTVPEEGYDQVVDWGDAGVFPHKTAATRAGLGWIGKTALFVSPEFGPRVRLATVFTDLALPAGTPVEHSRCGSCRSCVDACPAGAGRDVRWEAGMARDALYDEKACELETERYPDLGGVCGVCMAVCPWGR